MEAAASGEATEPDGNEKIDTDEQTPADDAEIVETLEEPEPVDDARSTASVAEAESEDDAKINESADDSSDPHETGIKYNLRD